MIPMRNSSIFKSRWMALLWAAGILYFAYDFVGQAPAGDDSSAAASQPTDATGAKVTPEQEREIRQILDRM